MVRVIINLEFEKASVEKEDIYDYLEDLIFNEQLEYTKVALTYEIDNSEKD